MRNRAGFTIIELLLGMFFSSMILVTLFNSFSLLDRISQFVDRIINQDVRTALINNQLQKDISGAFIPIQAIPITEKKTTGSPPNSAQSSGELKKDDQKKPLENIFVGTQKDTNLEMLSFITNNPLRVYEKEKGIIPKPRIVRVVYRLVPDKERKGSFVLTRQEGLELSLESYNAKAAKQIKAYEIAHLIKSMKLEYQAPKQKDEKEKSDAKEQKTEFRILKEWPDKEKGKNENAKPELPQFLKVDLVLWDEAMEKESAYTFIYEIYVRE